VFTFYYIFPRLEDYLRGITIFALLAPLIILHGLIHTLAFWDSPIPFTGMEGVSIYLLALTTLFKKDTKIKLPVAKPVKLSVVSAVVVSLWTLIKAIPYVFYDTTLSIELLSGGLFGITFGALTYFQFKFFKKFFKKEIYVPPLVIPKPEELKMAMIAQTKANQQRRAVQQETYTTAEKALSREERLDQILDKINDSGKDSLTDDENRFLIDYSNDI
jgi:hypothetical protein